MPKQKNLRRRPAAPNLNLKDGNKSRRDSGGPASPPETPTQSPATARKNSLKQRHQPPPFHEFSFSLANDPNIRPVGTGHQFSYQPGLAPSQLSPRLSSSSSSEAEHSGEDESDSDVPEERGDSDDDEGSEEAEDDESSSTDGSEPLDQGPTILVATASIKVDCRFTVEDLDPMDSDIERLEVLLPTEIESIRSRSRSRHKDLDRGMMQGMRDLDCSNEVSDNDDDETDIEREIDEETFRKRRLELKQQRRVSMSSSFGKRTHSEISDSDSDGDGTADVNELGSSARRLRKRLHRTSLLFQDPPTRIEELEEPDSGDDVLFRDHTLARELPYWEMEIMDVDSS